MYASPCDYTAVTSWTEAVERLAEMGSDATVIAGGQSLIPLMTLRIVSPQLLVDVSRADQPGVYSKDGTLVISALTRHAELERSLVIRESCPLLSEAASFIGNARVRHRGTMGGSIAHADPSAELPCAAVAVGATVRVLGPEGERRIDADALFDTYFTTTLRNAEVVTAVEVPTLHSGTGWSFRELVRRAGDFAVVMVAALVTLEAGICTHVRLAAGGVADRPIDLSEAASVLLGEAPDEHATHEVGRRAMQVVDPGDSAHVSGEYRRKMLGVFVGRTLLEAVDRAGSEPG